MYVYEEIHATKGKVTPIKVKFIE